MKTKDLSEGRRAYEAKRAAKTESANVIQYEPYDQQVKDLDLEHQALASGAETEPNFDWQYRAAQSTADAQIDAEVSGPDVQAGRTIAE